MNKKVNAEFNPERKSITPSKELIFRVAQIDDAHSILKINLERRPDNDPDDFLKKIKDEIELSLLDDFYKVFVAEISGSVFGFCRYYHSKDIPREKKIYEAPEGIYCMGTIVLQKMRRNGIAKFLSEERFKWLKNQGCKEAYSVVAADNPASVKMHHSFGYQILREAEGFLNIRFDCGKGFLFSKVL